MDRWRISHPAKLALQKRYASPLRHEGKRVSFGLFGVGWIALDLNGAALLKDGQRLPLFEFWLRTAGHVIGPRDMQSRSTHGMGFRMADRLR